MPKRATRPEMSWIESRQKWRKRVTIDGKTHDVYGDTKEEVREKVDDLKRQAVVGVPLGRNTIFYQYTSEWAKTKAAGVRQTTADNYYKLIDNYMFPVLGNMRLSDIKPLHIQQVLANRPDLTRGTQRRILGLLSRIMESAVDNDLISKNPCKGIKPGGEPAKEKTPLTKEQQETVCKAVEGTRLEAFALLCLYAGLRREEALGLTWTHVHLDTDTPYLDVRNTVVKDTQSRSVYSSDLKTPAAKRSIPIPPKLADVLTTEKKKAKSFFVVPSPRSGEPMNMSTLTRWWEIYLLNNVQFHVHPHLLRHTYISELCAGGMDIKKVQYLAGHSDVSMTLKVYAHAINNRPEELSKGIVKIFSGSN